MATPIRLFGIPHGIVASTIFFQFEIRRQIIISISGVVERWEALGDSAFNVVNIILEPEAHFETVRARLDHHVSTIERAIGGRIRQEEAIGVCARTFGGQNDSFRIAVARQTVCCRVERVSARHFILCQNFYLRQRAALQNGIGRIGLKNEHRCLMVETEVELIGCAAARGIGNTAIASVSDVESAIRRCLRLRSTDTDLVVRTVLSCVVYLICIAGCERSGYFEFKRS